MRSLVSTKSVAQPLQFLQQIRLDVVDLGDGVDKGAVDALHVGGGHAGTGCRDSVGSPTAAGR